MEVKAPHLGTLVLLVALNVVTLNMFLPALPAMQAEFGVSAGVMGLTISAYMALAAGLQLIIGPLSDRMGRRPVLLWALVLYCLGSFLGYWAQDFALFLMARMVQALAVSGAVISSAVVRDVFDERAGASKLGTIAAAMAIAPMLAPMIGGLLGAQAGWRAIFLLYTALGLLALTLAFFDLSETRQAAVRPRLVDYAALLRARVFWAYATCMSFAVGAFYVFLAGAPFVGAQVFGLGAERIGIGLGSITAGFMFGSALTARLVDRIGPGGLMLAGRWAGLIGLLAGLALFAAGADHYAVLFGATILVGFGNGLTMANAHSGALSVRPDLAGTAAGLAGALMLIVGAGLTTLATALLSAAATPDRLLSVMLVSVLVSLAAALAALRWRG